MVNSDPKRTPSFTMFGDPDFFFQTGNVCKGPSPDPGVPECVNSELRLEPRRHPGRDRQHLVRHGRARRRPARGRQQDVDRPRRPPADDQRTARPAGQLPRRRSRRHGDPRPTIRPEGLREPATRTEDLGAAYKQINAPFGQFATDTLTASTAALKTTDPLKYDSIEASIANLDVAAKCARRHDPAGAERRRVGRGDAQRRPVEGLDQPGAEPARPGSRARGGESRPVARRSRSTSEGSSSRHRPGSSPSSVNGP